MTARRTLRFGLVALVVLLALAPRGGDSAPVAAANLSFTVNSTADAPDANPGDGICADAAGKCTLRAAIQEADAQPSGSRIAIDVPAGTYGLTLGTLMLTANTIAISGALSSTTIISGNNTSSIMAISPTVRASLSQLTITGGNAGTDVGGGLVNAGLTVLSQSAVISNSAASKGGGIINDPSGHLWLLGSTLSGNTATTGSGGFWKGGGIWNGGTMTMTNSTLSGNAAGFQGGGIFNYYLGTLSVISSTLSSNAAGNHGGGIWNSGAMTVTSSTVSGNRASGPGAGINNGGTMTVTSSTVSGNSTNTAGGGIYEQALGRLSLSNSTLSGNTANDGGGIFNNGLGTLTVRNSTLNGNAAYDGSGIYNYRGGTLVSADTIVANGTSGPNCSGRIMDHGYNLDSGTSCGFSQTTDIINTNPLLGPLANNGGPTQTMALLPGSPAIDEGGTHATGCPATDQRGMPRPDEAKDKGACDMGAYESQGIG